MAILVETKHKLKNGIEVTLRSARPGEGAEVLTLVKHIMTVSQHLLTEPDELSYTVEQEDKLFADYAAHPLKIIINPVVDGRIVGMMTFSAGGRKRNAHQGEFGISIHPDFQGQGVGTLMIKALLDWAKQTQQIETVRLRVHAGNKEGIALYRKMGFQEEGREIRGVKFSDGRYDDVLAMAKHVADEGI